jgi:hypothetical protein
LLNTVGLYPGVAAAAPFCPGNGPATLDPAFAALVDRIGTDVVGSAAACIYKAGNTGIFSQETTLGTLVHNLDGTISFVTSYQSPVPNEKWVLRPDGTFLTPDGQQVTFDPGRSLSQPPSSQQSDAPAPAPAALLPADDPAVAADRVTPGRYACYAQLGGSSSGQVNRSAITATKEIYPDGTWRDTTYGSTTANNPAYAGGWEFDGTTLTLMWNDGAEDLYTPETRTDGSPQLVEFDQEQNNLTCYLVS